MDTSAPIKPMTMTQMMVGLGGIISKDAMQTLTAKKKPRLPLATRTAEKILKPMTIAQMKADIKAIKIQSPKRSQQGTASAKKRWNSSVKVEKKIISLTANGQMSNHPVRKTLNFLQPKPKMGASSHTITTMMSSETPKFTKPLLKAKKSILPQDRISGVYQIPETPLLANKLIKKRMTIVNKENISPHKSVVNKKLRTIAIKPATPKSCLRKKVMMSRLPDTPLSNESWKSSCDASFLQNEKDIEFIEGKTKALSEEHTLEDIAEVSPPVSTPFKEYRNVKEYFNNSSVENSAAYLDNTITCFDKTSVSGENSKREESVIVSLCDMLNKAALSNPYVEKINTELDELLEVERQTENDLKMIEIGLRSLQSIKESQMKSLHCVKKLIKEKQKELESESENNKTLIENTKDNPKTVNFAEETPKKTPVVAKSCSVIKSCLKSPSYKIPRKNMSSLKKKVLFRSMPNVSKTLTPPKDMGSRAMSMYMKMKEHMDFLTTPVASRRTTNVPDTPAITSHNLQMQLDNLYSES